MLRSTVLPGTTDREIVPAIEEASGLRCGVDFEFCYVPEFVAAGSVVRDMLNPGLVVAGAQDDETWPRVEEFYKRCIVNTPPFHRMSVVNAELAKIALNVYCVAAKINFANVLGELCERLPGADADVVTRAVGSDPRIGTKVFTAGTAYGGPCFVKDVKSYAAVLARHGVSPSIFEAIDMHNESGIPRLAESIIALLEERGDGGGTVGIFGVAFKPGVASVADSAGMQLAVALAERSVKVILHDPLALEEARGVMDGRENVRYAGSIGEGLRAADVAVFATADPVYRGLRAEDFEETGPLAVIDCWRMLPFLRDVKGIRYLPSGIGMAGGRRAQKMFSDSEISCAPIDAAPSE